MIVRCSKCNSAFAVDDDKVMNKRFAFTCPKCDNENIFDNRKEKKSDLTGQAVVDEAHPDVENRLSKERTPREEALVGTEQEEYAPQPVMAENVDHGTERNLHAEDDSILEDSLSIDDDLSGLAEPEGLEETEPSLESAELPPADDMQSDVPLDDLAIDDELKDLDMPDTDFEKDIAPGTKPRAAAGETALDDFDEIPVFKSTSAPIKDEMEPGDAGEPVELDEIDDIDKILAEDVKEKEIVDDFKPLDEEALKSTGDETEDIDIGGEIKTEEMYRADEGQEDESITIDLDSLDIDLEGEDGSAIKKGSDAGGAAGKQDVSADEDENITIDLDSLDIDLKEDAEVLQGENHEDLDLDISDFSEETIQELEGTPKDVRKDDDDITLDLDTLDISLDETGEIKKGEAVDEDEKLTIDDAGLTLDELTPIDGSRSSLASERMTDEEDIKLRIDDIDPNLDMHAIEKELHEAESILTDEPVKDDDLFMADDLSDLPEIDFDEEFNKVDDQAVSPAMRGARRDDDVMSIEDVGRGPVKKGGLQKDIPDMVPQGAVNFSIDYSIKYSRGGALLRLLLLFFIGLIPHYVVFSVYNVLSLILGFINYIVVIFSGKSVEDFSGIHENTLRYLLSISASGLGIVEEMPIFAGRDNIDYPLQMRIVYPLHSSRILAFLRLTGLGIIIILLPHLLILGVMSLAIPLVFLIGEFSVLITGGWPYLLFDFMIRYYRYTARVLAFCIGIIDQYPRFKFD